MKTYFLKIFFALTFFLLPFVASAGIDHALSGWAWSDNIGWVSFNSTNCDTDNNGKKDIGCGGDNTTGSVINYGVDKGDQYGYLCGNASCSIPGYAWSDNIGWIQFGNLGGFPSGNNTVPQNAQVEEGVLRGWAKALSADGNGWDGWISLGGTWTDPATSASGPYSITLDANTNPFCVSENCPGHDFAWGSDVVGWVNWGGVRLGPAVPPAGVCSVNIDLDTEYNPGETITVNWTARDENDENTGTDWIGIIDPDYPEDTYSDSAGDDIYWDYVSEASTPIELLAPQNLGSYEIRYLQDDGFTQCGNGAGFTVVDPVEPPISFTVTPIIAGTGTGSINPNSPQTVSLNGTQSFTVAPATGHTVSTSGCGGSPTTSQNGSYTYTTGNITQNCTVTATFTPPPGGGAPIPGQCSVPALHYNCLSIVEGGSGVPSPEDTQESGPSNWTWICPGLNDGADSPTCYENKTPIIIEPR
ncbi:hypothetical protein A2738_03560 [Candidatus Nomurabacteria bacterium RIFCSPHIGHO2_01_FULL_42_15]|uniref:Ig-like domain-containing protein n=1 Tax=Candidatus Nomurabacteria bacterium RIFCSPHIGHO2_01_FULL_42_15 TaxID=1801742 RepID=A0A1F6VE17_9BACT|nr:MAG: hypothetical protein A2738_03560 [Candidatus Nomurabacteria bacterium RIFCSPHIGHO2_01_FULL_42_15]OGI93281.1 MAG: hypothetical protein A3A99_03415 [Candidatus Nomurabacteria bacterium RIFCSPLOWO2_01_FULL_41_18]